MNALELLKRWREHIRDVYARRGRQDVYHMETTHTCCGCGGCSVRITAGLCEQCEADYQKEAWEPPPPPPCECRPTLPEGWKCPGTKFLGSCGVCGKPVHASCSTYGGPDHGEPWYCGSECWSKARPESRRASGAASSGPTTTTAGASPLPAHVASALGAFFDMENAAYCHTCDGLRPKAHECVCDFTRKPAKECDCTSCENERKEGKHR